MSRKKDQESDEMCIRDSPVATFNPVITKLCNLSSIEAVENKADGSGSFMIGTTAVSYTHLYITKLMIAACLSSALSLNSCIEEVFPESSTATIDQIGKSDQAIKMCIRDRLLSKLNLNSRRKKSSVNLKKDKYWKVLLKISHHTEYSSTLVV